MYSHLTQLCQPRTGVCSLKTTTLLAVAIFFASSATAQQTERVLHFTAISSTEDFQAIADLILSITDIPQANVDKTEKALSLHGTAGQIALAEWLFTNLDKPSSMPQSGDKHQYRVSDSADDVVRLFYLTNPEVPTGVQEIAIAVNSLTGIPHMRTYNDLRAIAVRGTAEQVNMVEFLFAEMDKPAIQHTPSQHLPSAASPEFRMNQAPENLVRVFFVPNIKRFRISKKSIRWSASLPMPATRSLTPHRRWLECGARPSRSP